MKQVRIHGVGDVRVDEVDEPTAGPRDAVVAVAACGICGSDLTFAKLGPFTPDGSPMPLGHELSGTVTEVGSEVTRYAVGDRVVVVPGNDELGRIGCGTPEGGLAPLLLVKEADVRLYAVPDGIDLATAALAEPLAVGMNAADQADVSVDDAVAVFGCGPVGLAAIATLADRGVTRLVAIDPSAKRRELALGLGASQAIDPQAEKVWERLAELHGSVPTMMGPTPGTDAFIEATAVGPVVQEIVANAKPNARISVVAVHNEDVPVSFLLVMMKQLTIRGAMEYPARFELALELLARKDLSSMITHTYSIGSFGDALEMLQTSKECGKVLITMAAHDEVG
ncbi:MAG: alcohol dehydrogenase catalytic domain-containing protein [Propionibacteriales bacterium]|nr:alcohol dehydrogenase catalytic domain-containing protein [Propionibacteriales bacterium]